MCNGRIPHGHAAGTGQDAAAHQHRFYFDPDIPPVLEVDPGEEFALETLDCTAGRIRSEGDLIESLDDLFAELGGLNPVSGPIAVRGVRAGDVMRVTVVDIDPAPLTHEGFIATIPGFGALDYSDGRGLAEPTPATTTICRVTRDEVVLPLGGRQVRLPSRPFIGTIGVAPKAERRMTLSQSPDYLGDIDIPDLRAGSTISIRAHHDGGLLSIGDVHAAQGDAEVAGVAVEIASRVRLKIDVVPRGETRYNRLPLLTDAEHIGVVAAYNGLPTSLCVRSAAVELCELLVGLGLSVTDAVKYLSAAMRVRVGNMFEPFYSTFVYVDRQTLPVDLPAEFA